MGAKPDPQDVETSPLGQREITEQCLGLGHSNPLILFLLTGYLGPVENLPVPKPEFSPRPVVYSCCLQR